MVDKLQDEIADSAYHTLNLIGARHGYVQLPRKNSAEFILDMEKECNKICGNEKEFKQIYRKVPYADNIMNNACHRYGACRLEVPDYVKIKKPNDNELELKIGYIAKFYKGVEDFKEKNDTPASSNKVIFNTSQSVDYRKTLTLDASESEKTDPEISQLLTQLEQTPRKLEEIRKSIIDKIEEKSLKNPPLSKYSDTTKEDEFLPTLTPLPPQSIKVKEFLNQQRKERQLEKKGIIDTQIKIYNEKNSISFQSERGITYDSYVCEVGLVPRINSSDYNRNMENISIERDANLEYYYGDKGCVEVHVNQTADALKKKLNKTNKCDIVSNNNIPTTWRARGCPYENSNNKVFNIIALKSFQNNGDNSANGVLIDPTKFGQSRIQFYANNETQLTNLINLLNAVDISPTRTSTDTTQSIEQSSRAGHRASQSVKPTLSLYG
jgi:hypothetical protein